MEFIRKTQEKIYQTIDRILMGNLQVLEGLKGTKYSEAENEMADLKRNQILYLPNKEEFDNFQNVLKNFNKNQIFKIEEIPEVFKNKIIKEAGGLEKKKLKKAGYIPLIFCLHVTGPNKFNCLTEYLREGGLKYVGKKEGGPGLKINKGFRRRGHAYEISSAFKIKN
jgi:hypothetical protein